MPMRKPIYESIDAVREAVANSSLASNEAGGKIEVKTREMKAVSTESVELARQRLVELLATIE